MKAIKLRPNKWYNWINPWWWKKAKAAEKVMNFYYEEITNIKNSRIDNLELVIWGTRFMKPMSWEEKKNE